MRKGSLGKAEHPGIIHKQKLELYKIRSGMQALRTPALVIYDNIRLRPAGLPLYASEQISYTYISAGLVI